MLWTAAVVSATVGAMVCALQQLNRYNLEPLVVSVERDYRRWWSTFPAVTACLIGRMDERTVAKLIQRQWNTTMEGEPERYQYYRSLVELVSDVNFRSNIQSFWKYQNDPTVANVNLLDMAVEVHPKIALRATTANGGIGRFTPVMTEMGLCWTFNSLYDQYQAIVDDPQSEHHRLVMCHYNSLQCHVRIEAVNEPVRFFIHSPYDIPDAVSNPVGALEPGMEAVLDFAVLEMQAAPAVRALNLDQRRCRYPDEGISPDIQAYSYGLCQMHCRSKMSLMFCGCRPFFHVRGEGEVCDAHGMACVGRNAEILINLPKNLARCSCTPQCTQLNYFSHGSKIFVRSSTEDSTSESEEEVATDDLPDKEELVNSAYEKEIQNANEGNSKEAFIQNTAILKPNLEDNNQYINSVNNNSETEGAYYDRGSEKGTFNDSVSILRNASWINEKQNNAITNQSQEETMQSAENFASVDLSSSDVDSYNDEKEHSVERNEQKSSEEDTEVEGENNEKENVGTSEEGEATKKEEVTVALRLNLRVPKTRLHRNVIFGFQELIASVGGTLALFVGASALTLLELAFFVFEVGTRVAMRAWRSLKQTSTQEKTPQT